MNEGCFRAVRMHLPPGTLVNPNPPAACGGRVITVTAAIEAVLAALAQARPDHRVAPSALIHVYSLTGIGTDGRPWVNLFYDFGGIGARHGVDGPDATGCYFLGGRSVIPQIEPLEAQYPFVVRRSRLLPDSGGVGQWRGGLGTEIVVELLGDAELTVRGDRIELPPPGVDGGGAGAPGVYAVERADGTTEVLADEAGWHPPRGRRPVRDAHVGWRRSRPAASSAPAMRCSPTCESGRVTRARAVRDYQFESDE